MVAVSAENREKAKVSGGQAVDVDIELDTEPREMAVPADFAAALGCNAKASKAFDGLSFSKKKGFVQGIEGLRLRRPASAESKKPSRTLLACGPDLVEVKPTPAAARPAVERQARTLARKLAPYHFPHRREGP